MGNCSTCSAITPGFVAVDAITGQRIPDDTAPMDYDGIVGAMPCPQCNAARRAVAVGAPHLLDRKTDRDGYPEDWHGTKDTPSWRPHLRGGTSVDPGKLKPISTIKALLISAGRQVAKQGELIADYHKKR